ncbi:hypothetical protein GCM10018980_12810 [Streptomyces capoamus]|uniref:Uncharacterized protein n=1 Tax=Streptomyces capoamus TaxID=68183 RepID=A0A919EU66_9ACTN|nr:hypothetical protein GCM10010501_21640 [Streptomyces libani subsp. rufus]GHG39383.1 hypothetical protein GCM10018980_12810 [Streptomyces capoamus]
MTTGLLRSSLTGTAGSKRGQHSLLDAHEAGDDVPGQRVGEGRLQVAARVGQADQRPVGGGIRVTRIPAPAHRGGVPLWRRPPRRCDGFRTSTRAGTP